MIFTPTAPGQSTLSSPAGNTADVTPLYTWSAVPGATWYYLWVTGSSSTVITQFYPASAVCSGSTCSVEQPTPLSSGTYNWWIQTYGEVGYGPWSSGLSFTTVAPGPAVLSSPTGSIMTNNPSYTWSAVPGATWYYLLVEGPSGTVTQKWYAASEANCNGTTCSVANATTGLAAGTYSWWIQTYNSIGYGAWSSEMIFTTP